MGISENPEFIGDMLRDLTMISSVHGVSSSTETADALLFSKCGMTKVLGHTAEACLSAL